MERKYICILGILFLLVVGFFVYYYVWNRASPYTESFQSSTNANTVFILNKYGCQYRITSKINALDICNALGARLPTYDELYEVAKTDVTASKRLITEPVFVLDSDLQYSTYNVTRPLMNGSSSTAAFACYGILPTETSIEIKDTEFAGKYFIRHANSSEFSCSTTAPPSGSKEVYINLAVPDINANEYVNSNTYKIIDLDVVYSQVDIAMIDIPKRRDIVIANEIAAGDALRAMATSPTAIATAAATRDASIASAPGRALQKVMESALTRNPISYAAALAAEEQSAYSVYNNTINATFYTNLRMYTGENMFNMNTDPLKETMRRIVTGFLTVVSDGLHNGGDSYTNLNDTYTEIFRSRIPYYGPLMNILYANVKNDIQPTQYLNIRRINVNEYYTKLLNAINTHPIAFLRKGIMNFPSMMNTLKVYNFPTPTSPDTDIRLVGGLSQSNLPKWDVNEIPNSRILTCVEASLSNKEYGLAAAGTAEGVQTVDFHNPAGKWCVDYKYDITKKCDWDYWPRSWRLGMCTKEYYRNETVIGETDFMIGAQQKQREIENSLGYNRTIDVNWRLRADSGNPIQLTSTPQRTIRVVGAMNQRNMDEIKESIKLVVCFNFTDTTILESQIRISSTSPYYLHMSPDASAFPEFKNVLNPETKISTIVPENAAYNSMHCGKLLTYNDMYLLPFHTRDMIFRWAKSRYARVKKWGDEGVGAVSTAGQTDWREGGSTSVSFLSGSPVTEYKFFSTTITEAVRKALLDEMAQFYYRNEINDDMGSETGSLKAEAIINKFVDVFQVGDTIFDVRFEEYRKRGISFQTKLAELHQEYESYKTMNLSREDQIELELRYIKSKQELYRKDALNIWGTEQDCGTSARYIVITTADYFFISQLVVINSAGTNIASIAQIDIEPEDLYYSSPNDNPNTAAYYDDVGNLLSSDKRNKKIDEIKKTNTQIATGYMIDGIVKPKWYPSVYRSKPRSSTSSVTSGSVPNQLIFDLGSQHKISRINIILPMDPDPTGSRSPNPYSVSLTNSLTEDTSSKAIVGNRVDRTITYDFRGTGEDKDSCPPVVFDRFQVARFYTTFTAPTTTSGSSKPWTVTGYSKGISAALTFDYKYNAGIPINLSINGGNMVYSPDIVYDLNYGGSPPPLVCSDPTQIKKIFSDYNIYVNDPDFQMHPNHLALGNLGDSKSWAKRVLKSRKQVDPDTCGYTWIDEIMDTDGSVTEQQRWGKFKYPLDTENWNANQRVFDAEKTEISSTDITGVANTNPYIDVNIDIPRPYVKSTVLDNAGGFCPALPCSDIRVMQSLIQSYNTNVSKNGGSYPLITKVHKAVTPTPYRCEFLVETGTNSGSGSSGSVPLRKVQMLVKTEKKEECEWLPIEDPKGIVWDRADNLLDSTPYLTRIFNYALDILRPFGNSVTTIVNDLVGLGSGQLDASGSGIMNVLVKYRTETAAAAGEVRYFDEVDEMGNICAPLESSSGLYSSANYPRCRSSPILNSLYSYYRNKNPLGVNSGNTVSRIVNMIRAGQTDDGLCDYTFSRTDYSGSNPPTTNSYTSGLRCVIQRVPYSCNYAVTSCTSINPVPSKEEITAIPKQFVQQINFGSGSGSSAGSGSNPPAITAAGLNATYGSQTMLQPTNSNTLLRSVDYIDCSSDYAKRALGLSIGSSTTLTRVSYTQCNSSTNPFGIFFKSGTNMLYTRGSIPTGLTSVTGAGDIADSYAQTLLPYTIVGTGRKVSAGVYEYRISENDRLPFGDTYIRAQFYYDTTLASNQLSLLRPATPVDSPYAFHLTIGTDITALANRFLQYWNGIFTDRISKQQGATKIGKITGYSIDTTADTIIFKTEAARFGNLGQYDVRAYSNQAYYTVGFRNTYTGNTIITYSVSPISSAETFITTSSATFTAVNISDSTSSLNYVVQSQDTIMTSLKMFRSFRFKVQTVKGGGQRAEIARIFFYSGAAPTFTKINVRDANVTVEGVLANYILPPSETVCKTGYTKGVSADNITVCFAPNISYPFVPGTSCGIGYYNDGTGNCKSSGYFLDVLNNALVTATSYDARLRLNLNQYLYVDLKTIANVNAYSFVVGSSATAPIKWQLEGSLDNINWTMLHAKTTGYTYPGKVSFFSPGIFAFSFSNTSIADATATQIAMYGQGSSEITEGFKSPDRAIRRLRTLRWKIRETQVPTADYVHASSLQFHTMAGPIPASTIKISNPHGTRRSSANAPNKILSTDGGRWVDLNKTDLLITFDLDTLPANRIYGFQFAVPPNVENSVDFVPAKWLLEGTYDGHTWISLHEKVDRARILGDASPIYNFSQQI